MIGARYLTMRELGQWGRFGNQCLQCIFLKTYARQYNLELQLPPWVGNHLFNTDDPTVTEDLESWTEEARGLTYPVPPQNEQLVNRDYRGYAAYHTNYLQPYRKWTTQLFQPTLATIQPLQQACGKLRNTAGTIIGIHLRRGDYGYGIFPIIPVMWYLRWLKDHWIRFENPTLFIATESPELVEQFEDYSPQTTTSLGIELTNKPLPDCTYLSHDLQHPTSWQMNWLPDWYLLSQCDVLVTPNSTFSFFAGMMGNPLEYWRASLAAGEFVQIEPWSAWPLLREHVQGYAHLEGIRLDSNPYWGR